MGLAPPGSGGRNDVCAQPSRVIQEFAQTDKKGLFGARPVGREETDAAVSYFNGNQDDWRTGIPTYSGSSRIFLTRDVIFSLPRPGGLTDFRRFRRRGRFLPHIPAPQGRSKPAVRWSAALERRKMRPQPADPENELLIHSPRFLFCLMPWLSGPWRTFPLCHQSQHI